MLIRLLVLLVLLGGAVALWRSSRGDPRLRLPGRWTAAAARHSWLGEPLALRQSIVKRVIASDATHAADLVADVDEVVARLVDIAEVDAQLDGASEALAERLEASLAKLAAEKESAIGWLGEAYAVLIEAAADEFDASVGQLQERLHAQKEELQLEVEARREIQAAVSRSTR